MNMFENTKQQFRNAQVCIAQIRRGEWTPRYNDIALSHLVARGPRRREMWIANGPFFCDVEVDGRSCFGLIFRHWVWWAAARKLKRDADRAVNKTPVLEDDAP